MPTDEIYGLILLGGMSSRFGSPKGNVRVDDSSQNSPLPQDSSMKPCQRKPDQNQSQCQGQYQYQSLSRLLAPHCTKLYYSLSRQSASQYPELPTESCILDDKDIESCGPMAGLLSAMRRFPDKAILLVSVDLFFVDGSVFIKLCEERDTNVYATLYEYEKLQPLCTIYEPKIRPRLEEAAENKAYGLYKLLLHTEHKIIHYNSNKDIHPLTQANTREAYLKCLELMNSSRESVHK